MDTYGNQQSRAQRDSVAARQVERLRNGGRTQPLHTHPSQVAQEGALLEALKAVAAGQGAPPAVDPLASGFADSIGLGRGIPGMVPDYGTLDAQAGYQQGFGRPNIPHGLPPQTISAAPGAQFADAPFESHAGAAAMDPGGVAAAADAQRNDDADPMGPRNFQDARAALEQLASGSMDPETGNLTYSNGKLADQPWFPAYVQASQAMSGASDDQRANMEGIGGLPTIQHTGAAMPDRAWNSFKKFYDDPRQVARRGKRDSGIARAEAIADSPRRQRAMQNAAFRDNPQMATLEALRRIGGGNDGAMGLPAMGAMAMMGLGDAIPGAMAAQAQMGHNQQLIELERQKMGMQQMLMQQNQQNNLAQLPLGKEGDMVRIRQVGGFANLPKEEQAAVALRILNRHNNRMIESQQELAEHGMTDHDLVQALGGNLPDQNASFWEFIDRPREEAYRARAGVKPKPKAK